MSKASALPIDNKPLKKHFIPGSKVLVAVSGGIDSSVCAHILSENSNFFEIEVAYAYINHKLRPEADNEEKFVEDISLERHIPFFVASLDLPEGADLQSRAREMRYAALEKIAVDNGYDNVVTAHTRDDQAETVLFRVLRGTGAKGMAGIHTRSGIFIRPLLNISRHSIEQYAEKFDVPFVEDASNLSDHYSRNRIRHKAIPVLNDVMGFDVRPVLARLANISLMESRTLDELALTDEKAARQIENVMCRYDLTRLLKLSPGRRLGVYRNAIEKAKGDLLRIKTINLEQIEVMAHSPEPSAELHLPCRVLVFREYNTLLFELDEPPSDPSLPVEISKEGQYDYAGRIIRIEKVKKAELVFDRSSTVVFADLRFVDYPFIMRALQPGDRMVISGGQGSKKLSRLMIDAKIPKRKRGAIPLLCDKNGIIWVPGIGLAERVTPGELTVDALKLSIS